MRMARERRQGDGAPHPLPTHMVTGAAWRGKRAITHLHELLPDGLGALHGGGRGRNCLLKHVQVAKQQLEQVVKLRVLRLAAGRIGRGGWAEADGAGQLGRLRAGPQAGGSEADALPCAENPGGQPPPLPSISPRGSRAGSQTAPGTAGSCSPCMGGGRSRLHRYYNSHACFSGGAWF